MSTSTRIPVTSNNALVVAEVVLRALNAPAHFTTIGAKATELGYEYTGEKHGGDIAVMLRVSMWNDTNGDEKAAKSKFVRCANRVYRLREVSAPENFESKSLVPRKGKVTSAPQVANVTSTPAPGASGAGHTVRRPEPVAALVAIALNKPTDARTEEQKQTDDGEANKAAQEQALADMKAAAAEANKSANKPAAHAGRSK